jgi:hypothetical protein
MRYESPITAALALMLLALACTGSTGPGESASWPVTPSGSVDLGAPASDIAFLGETGDLVAAAGSDLCFIDGSLSYLLARVPVSVVLAEVASTSDGGYALAAGGSIVYRVSNQTYLLQDSLQLPGMVEELVVHDYAGEVWVLLEGGDVLTVDIGTMAAIDTCSPGQFETACGLYLADVPAVYRGGAGIQLLGVPGLSVTREADLPAPAEDLAGRGDCVYAAMGTGGLRALSSWTLATVRDYGLPSCRAVDVIGGSGALMASTLTGVSVLGCDTGDELARYAAGSPALLVSAAGDGSRAAAVFESAPSVAVVLGTR